MIIDGKSFYIKMNNHKYHCAIDITMGFIGGKWKMIILWYLKDSKQRFSELKKQIPDITEKMLSLQLRELEANGIIERKIYPQVPPKVEYFLTDKGKTLLPILNEAAIWGRNMGEKYGIIEEDLSNKAKILKRQKDIR